MGKFSMTNFTASFTNLGIIFCAALSLLFFPGLGLARDLDGKYANSPLKQWFESLASRRGPCCCKTGDRCMQGGGEWQKDQVASEPKVRQKLHTRGDFVTAMRIMRPLAEQGHATAQTVVGLMHYFNYGDYVSAHMWFSLAAAQGHAFAKMFLRDTADKMTPDQIAEAQKLAREWKPNTQSPSL